MAGAAGSFKSMFSEVKSILTLLMKKKPTYVLQVCVDFLGASKKRKGIPKQNF